MVNLEQFISDNNIGYLHNFGDTLILTKDMLKTLEKSKVENKYVTTVTVNGKDEEIDYLSAKDILALRDNKAIKCTWTKSRSGKPYWNHSAVYIVEEEEVA